MSVIHLEYRLAPEHPLPSAVDDAVSLYNSLIKENISPSQIIIMGDSAGGGLALLTIQKLISKQIPTPRGVVVVSPWTDLSASGQSYVRNRLTDAMLKPESVSWGIKHVLGHHHQQINHDHPMFSPLFGSFKHFPPMYITVGTAEILEDDSRELFKKAKQSGVNVTLEEGIDLAHVYPLFYPYYPEARKTLENIQKWTRKTYE
jgi:acetyl esterase/lipase